MSIKQIDLFPGTVASLPAAVTPKRRAARDGQLSEAHRTADSFQNFELMLGQGTANPLSHSTYGFNPITRNRTLLEWCYRGSWLGGIAVDLVADDMTREGVEFTGNLKPDQVEKLHRSSTSKGVLSAINDAAKWARLYGGAIAVMLIDGQDMSRPLDVSKIGKGQFKGMAVFDRWSLGLGNSFVQEYGPDFGKPEFYWILQNGPLMNRKVHHSRFVRLTGIELPYQQALAEDYWGLSVLERLYDRMVAFDSATQGAAQLIYKSALRTYKIKGLRELIATGGKGLAAVANMVEMMRRFQGIEGMTLMDANDEFEAHTVNVQAGISDALLQFGQQISGALQIPLVRLFGQSPAGLSATGESDLRTYYDNVKAQQNKELRDPLLRVYKVNAMSEGIKIDDEFNIEFRPLWQMDDKEKAEVSERDTKSVVETEGTGLISRAIALKELRQRGKAVGRWQSITDEDVAEAEAEAPAEKEAEQLLRQAQVENAARMAAGQPEDNGEAAPGKKKPGGDKPEAKNDNRMERRMVAANDMAFDELIPMTFQGMQLWIETEKGAIRSGNGWAVRMPADYGFIGGTGSAEGYREGMDCFIGPDRESAVAFVVDVVDPLTKEFDEHKVMLGFATEADALACFRAAYHDAREPMAVTPLRVGGLMRWLRTGDMLRPISQQAQLRVVP